MSKENETSATEKLLEMIRGEEIQSPVPDKLELERDTDSTHKPAEVPSIEGLSLESADTKGLQEDPSPQKPQLDIPLNQPSETSSPPAPETSSPSVDKPRPRMSSVAEELNLSLLSRFASPGIRVGVDIQPNCLNLAKLKVGSKAPRKSDFAAVELPELEEDTPWYKSEQVTSLLKETLNSFCKGLTKLDVWCCPNSEKTEVRTIVIPKVPDSALANAVYWATQKDTEFDPSEYIFDFSVVKEMEEGSTKKIVALAYLMPQQELSGIQEIFEEIGYPLAGITVPSSAIHNLHQKSLLPGTKETFVHLSFQSETSQIDIYHKGKMLFTREIKTGVNSFVESVFDGASTQDIIMDDASAKELVFSDGCTSITPVSSARQPELDVLSKTIDLQSLPVTGRLLRQLNRTFDYCSSNYKIPRATLLYTSGSYLLTPPIIKEMQSSLDFTCRLTDLFHKDTNPPPRLAASTPKNLNTAIAFGLALSDNTTTQNFLYTYTDKRKAAQENRLNQIFAAVTIVLAVIFGTLFFAQYQLVSGKKEVLNSLTSELNKKYQDEPRSQDTKYALLATKKISENLQEKGQAAQRFKVLAKINSILDTLPPEIKLTKFKIDPVKVSKKKRKSEKEKSGETINLTGFVKGPQMEQDFLLLHLQSNLNKLAFIRDANIKDTSQESYQDNKVLYFTIRMKTDEAIF